jgi:hypothetical protein
MDGILGGTFGPPHRHRLDSPPISRIRFWQEGMTNQTEDAAGVYFVL